MCIRDSSRTHLLYFVIFDTSKRGSVNFADLSRNDLTEIPRELYACWTLETLNCYHNSIRVLPDDIGQLQNLLMLNLRYDNLYGATLLQTAEYCTMLLLSTFKLW